MVRALQRFLSLESPAAEEPKAEAVLEQQKQALRDQLSHFNQSLAASAAFCELLKEQMRELEHRQSTFKAALDVRARSGDCDEAAGEFAAKWHSVSEELEGLRDQLATAEGARTEVIHAREDAIEAARRKLAEFRGALSEHEIRRALAEITGG